MKIDDIECGLPYQFIGRIPAGCNGHIYFAHRFVRHVPQGQVLVLVEALSGPDKGEWFVCSKNNFATRYKPVSKEESECDPKPIS